MMSEKFLIIANKESIISLEIIVLFLQENFQSNAKNKNKGWSKEDEI